VKHLSFDPWPVLSMYVELHAEKLPTPGLHRSWPTLALPADRRGVLEAEPPRAPQASGLPSAVVRLGGGCDGCDGFGGLVSGVGTGL